MNPIQFHFRIDHIINKGKDDDGGSHNFVTLIKQEPINLQLRWSAHDKDKKWFILFYRKENIGLVEQMVEQLKKLSSFKIPSNLFIC